MKKIIISIIIVFVLIIGVMIFLPREETVESDEIKITTTLFPYYSISKEIGGEKVNVSLLLPPGIDAHSFEPRTSDIIRISNSDIFIYTGEIMEPWAKELIDGLSIEEILIVNASQNINLIEADGHHHGKDHHHDSHHEDSNHEDHHHDSHHEDSNHEDHHHQDSHHEDSNHEDDNHQDSHHEDSNHGDHHHEKDPHIWLDIKNAKTISQEITNALIDVSPQNREFFEENLKVYNEKLDNLDKKMKSYLPSCKQREIIYSGHYAFAYFAKRYDLKHTAILGISHDSEPTISSLISVIEKIKNEDINFIFYEELSSPRIAEIIKEETGAEMLPLNPAENLSKEDFEKGISFIDIMEENINNLLIGLDCKI